MDRRINQLVNAVHSAAWEFRATEPKIIGELIQLGKDAVIPLLGILTRENQINSQIIEIFEQIGEPAFETLIEFLTKEQEGEILTETSSIEALTRILHRANAAKALGALGNPIAIKPLANVIISGRRDYYAQSISQSCAEALAQLGEPGLLKFLELLESNDEWILRWATFAAISIKDNRLFNPIIKLASHSNPNVRQNSIEALNNGKYPETLETILRAVKDVNFEVRITAIRSLRDFDAAQFQEIFIEKATQDPHELVRDSALEILSDSRTDKIFTNILMRVLAEDASIKVRRRAAKILGELKIREAAPLLVEAAKDEEVNLHAIQALSELNSLVFINDLLLQMATSEGEDGRRRRAVKFLGEVENVHNEEGLTQLKDKDPSERIRKIAAEALETLKRKENETKTGANQKL